jgi:phenylacetate-CoA ligase
MLYSFAVERMLLPAVGLLSASRFWQMTQQMRRSDRMPREYRERSQWEAMRRMLRHAFERVPFYRERFAEAGLTPDDLRNLDDLPRLRPATRPELAANFPDRVTAEGVAMADWRFAATSGTTSQRMVVIQDFAKRDAVRASALHSFTFSGLRLGSRYVEIPPDICNIQCGVNREPEPALLTYLRRRGLRGWNDQEARSTVRGLIERQVIYRQVTLPSFGSEGTNQTKDSLQEYVRRIRQALPLMLKGLPAYLLALARYLHSSGEMIAGVREVRPMGSALAPAVNRLIAEAFGCPVVEDYGSAELGGIACECGPGRGLHLFSDLFFAEVVRDGKPVRPGELGRILVTDLTNRAMPLIRYDIGDVGYLVQGSCSCGRTTPRLRILGRIHDTIVRRDGRVLAEHTVSDFLYGLPGVAWFQLLQRSDRQFDLRIVPDTEAQFSADTVAARTTAFLGDGARVVVSTVKTIAPETGGKFRFVKSTSHACLDDIAGGARAPSAAGVGPHPVSSGVEHP